ncbi:MAG: hypothetical protein EAZ41_09920, partial [Sphingobacteriia bacterium]
MGCKYRVKRKIQAILHKIFNYCMNILLKQVLITDPNSPFNGKIYDLLIAGSTISNIGTNLTHKNAT